MAIRFENPAEIYFDVDGVTPLTGGLLNFYEITTLTRKTTFADNALENANANPVVLSTVGRQPNIFLDGAYRVICTDALDPPNQIFDRDNINRSVPNPFDQELNTTDNVTFNSLALTTTLDVSGEATFTDKATFTEAVDITSAATSTALTINNSANTINDIFTIASADALTTAGMINLNSNSASTSTRSLGRISNNNILSSATTVLNLLQKSNNTCLFIGQEGDAPAINIGNSASLSSSIRINFSQNTSVFTVDIDDANFLTSGGLINLHSNSGDTTARDLVFIHNDSSAAVNVTPIKIEQDAVVDTNFKRYIVLDLFTIWTSDGTTAEANLTGVEGDMCLNGGTGAGQPAFCNANGTNWTDM